LDFRRRIYELLANWFSNGVDVSTFAESYTIRYGFPLSAERECEMPLDMALRLMADIVDTGRSNQDGRLWLRPVPYEQVKQLMTDKKIEEFDRDPDWKDLVKKKPEPNDDELDDHQLAVKVRAEVAQLVAPFHEEEGVNIENLAILYSVKFPKRGINRGKSEMLRAWLKAMPTVVKVFSKEEEGTGETAWYVQAIGGQASNST